MRNQHSPRLSFTSLLRKHVRYGESTGVLGTLIEGRDRVVPGTVLRMKPSQAEDDEQSDGGVGLGRTLALSDGVFAIAMTLLAFQIKLPAHLDGNGDGLARALGSIADEYYVYLLSFSVIGLLWLAHHRTFGKIHHADELLMGLNLLFLMTVAALPFPSAVLGQYGNQRAAVIVYASAMAIASGLLTALHVVVLRRGLMAPSVTAEVLRRGTWRSVSMAVVFALSIPVAIVAPKVAPFVWLGTFVLRVVFPISPRRRRRHETTPPAGVEP